MDFSDVVNHFGNGSVLRAAIALGLRRQTIYRWKKGIDPKTQAWLELTSGGALHANLAHGEGKAARRCASDARHPLRRAGDQVLSASAATHELAEFAGEGS